MNQLGMSARDFHRVLKLGRTIADLAGAERIQAAHLAEVIRTISGREVDLVERSAVEQSENYIRRKNILQNQEVIYAAG